MLQDFTFSIIGDGDSQEVFELVEACFFEFVEQDLTKEGIEEFFRASKKMIFERPHDHMIYVARFVKEIVGIIDVRSDGHICLFFVKSKFQKKGVGSELLKMAEAGLDLKDNVGGKMEVNASLFAVDAYEKMGFVQIKPVQYVNGIKFVPMEKNYYNI